MDGSGARSKDTAVGPSSAVESMPSLVRFLIVIAVLAGLVYGVMLALVTFVEPVPRPMEQAVPAAKLNPPKAGTATP